MSDWIQPFDGSGSANQDSSKKEGVFAIVVNEIFIEEVIEPDEPLQVDVLVIRF